jgi:hypothetical protein
LAIDLGELRVEDQVRRPAAEVAMIAAEAALAELAPVARGPAVVVAIRPGT